MKKREEKMQQKKKEKKKAILSKDFFGLRTKISLFLLSVKLGIHKKFIYDFSYFF